MKKPWYSKTLLVNAIVAGLAFFPSVAKSISPETIMQGMAVINIILRLVTKDKIGLEA